MKTITITKGNQYNQDGYRTSDGQWGEIVERMDGTIGLTVDGGILVGYDYDHNGQDEAIRAAIMLTIQDGQTRTVSLKDRNEAHSKPAPLMAVDVPPQKQLCPKCHTYCCGDCQS